MPVLNQRLIYICVCVFAARETLLEKDHMSQRYCKPAPSLLNSRTRSMLHSKQNPGFKKELPPWEQHQLLSSFRPSPASAEYLVSLVQKAEAGLGRWQVIHSLVSPSGTPATAPVDTVALPHLVHRQLGSQIDKIAVITACLRSNAKESEAVSGAGWVS